MIYTSCLKNKNQDIRREEQMTSQLSYPNKRFLARLFRENLCFFRVSESVRRKPSSDDELRLGPDRCPIVPTYWPAGATQYT